MFITKKHLSRRTFLRGMGVTLALPLLDSMIPAHTPLAKTAALAEEPLLLHLRPARRDDGQVDAGHRRQRLRVHRNAEAAREDSATASSSSATWRIRWPAARDPMPAPTTRARRPCS